MFSIKHKVNDTTNTVLREQSLFIQMYNPIVVIQYIYIFLQTILQGTWFEHCTGFGLIALWHDNFADAMMFWQIDWFVRDHFHLKIFESRVQACVHIPCDICLHQVGEVAARHHTYANEWCQQWTSLEHNFLGKCIVKGEAAKVEQYLW